MSRPLRIAYEGAWYHVINRGLARKRIFLNSSHYHEFLDLLSDIHNRYEVEIHAFCLMGNHYHLLLRTPKANISRAMRHLDGVYTQRFNKSMKRDGPIFRGRFKAILVEADTYLLQLSRYVHLNPVKAKLVKNPESYRWSSYSSFLDGNKPDWLITAKTLNYFGDKLQRIKYAAYVNEGIDDEIASFFDSLRQAPILGSDEFIKEISERYLQEEHKINDIPEHRLLTQALSLDISQVTESVSEYYEVDIDSLKSLSRKNRINIPRMISFYLCYLYNLNNSREVAMWFGDIKEKSVSQIFLRAKTMVEKSPELKRDLDNIIKRLNRSGMVLEIKT